MMTYHEERAARMEGAARAYLASAERAAGMAHDALARILSELARDAYGEAASAYAIAGMAESERVCRDAIKAVALWRNRLA